MNRALLRWVKHVSSAIVLLAVLYCCAELTLRVYDSCTGQVTRGKLYDRGLICKSWAMHHELKPLQRLAAPNPDTGASVGIVTNSYGLRGREPAVPKTPGVYRILCLGDEQTLAIHVAQAETFTARLERLLQSRSKAQIEVLNAGVPGYCPLLACLQFKHKLIGLEPDLVILNFDMSDVADDYRYRRHVFMDDHQSPLACTHPDLEMPRQKRGKTEHSRFLVPAWLKEQTGRVFARKMRPESQDIDAPLGKYLWLKDQAPDWSPYVRQALDPALLLRDLTYAAHADFVVAAYPCPWQVSADASNTNEARDPAGLELNEFCHSRRPFEMLARHFDEAKIPFCDASREFQGTPHGAGLYFARSADLNREGHQLYARILAQFVVANTVGPWEAASPEPDDPRPYAGGSPSSPVGGGPTSHAGNGPTRR